MFYYMIIIGLVFGYINGMHDGGTVVATTISSRLLSPAKAVCVAGIANFLGASALGTAVAYTISTNIIDIRPVLSGPQSLCSAFVAAAFTGSLFWNLLTWVLKLPSSASHSMIGAMIGSGICAYGSAYIQWHSIMIKVIAAMLFSPLLGFAAGYLFLRLLEYLLRNGTIVWNRAHTAAPQGKQLSAGLLLRQQRRAEGHGPRCHRAGRFLQHGYPGPSLAAPCRLRGAGGRNHDRRLQYDQNRRNGYLQIDIQNSFASQMSTIFVVMLANVTGLPISATQVSPPPSWA